MRKYFRNWFASGEPWIWMNAAAVGISVVAVVGILALIAFKGFAHFWPKDITLIQYVDEQADQHKVYGELIELDTIAVQQFLESGGNTGWVPNGAESMSRWLIKTGNRRHNPPDFRWLFTDQINEMSTPEGLVALERIEWGNAYGTIESLTIAGKPATDFTTIRQSLEERVTRANEIRREIDGLESGSLNTINYQLERLRLEQKGIGLQVVQDEERLAEISAEVAQLKAAYAQDETALRSLYKSLDQDELTIRTANNETIVIRVADILHNWFPNDMSTWDKTSHYAGSLWRFLSEDPREANTEGGIFPAIFGTVLMVLLMSLLVTPFGVIAAIYLREYAHQGAFVRIIRIAVNNLAGVPSIVYGVFGLGFFVTLSGAISIGFFIPKRSPLQPLVHQA